MLISRPILFALFIMLCISVGYSCSNTKAKQQINDATYQQLIDSGKVTLLDVRTPEEIKLGKIENALEIDVLGDNFKRIIEHLDKSTEYLVYCKKGGRSARACDIMRKNGFKNLTNMEGGYTNWIKTKH